MRRILQITAVTLLTAIFLGLFLWKANLRDVWSEWEDEWWVHPLDRSEQAVPSPAQAAALR